MPLHPTVAAFIATLPHPPPGPLNPEAMRAGDESHVPAIGERLPVHSVAEMTLETSSSMAAPGRSVRPVSLQVAVGDASGGQLTGDFQVSGGRVPVRVYTPTDAAEHGVLVYFHGGAFFLGSLNTHDHVARELANATGCKVVSVGYRLAPEHAFPAGLMDCYAVVRWVADHQDEFGWDGRTLAIAGDSSGGNFVAAIAGMALDDGFGRITHQVLYYPSVDLDFDVDRYESLRTNAVGNGLETAGLKPFNALYLEGGADPADPLVSPIKRVDLTGLPPALIVTAEFDPLRDEGELYGRNLAAAGVRVVVRRYESAGHGFVQHFSWLPEFHGVYAETAAFLKGTHHG